VAFASGGPWFVWQPGMFPELKDLWLGSFDIEQGCEVKPADKRGEEVKPLDDSEKVLSMAAIRRVRTGCNRIHVVVELEPCGAAVALTTWFNGESVSA
jgi:hypothetical protein